MTGYPPGNLKYGRWVAEVSYGTIPTGTLSWMGETVTAQDMTDYGAVFVPLPDSRSDVGAVQRGPFKPGFKARLHARASNWKNFFAKYGFGSTSGLTDALDSFTAVFDIYDGTTHNYMIYNGCKINSMTISAEKPGAFYVFDIEVMCQYAQRSTSKTLTTFQSVTVGADPTPPTSAILYWSGISQRNINAGGATNWYPESFSVSINHGLEPAPGNVLGADAAYYPVPIALHEGTRSITWEGKRIIDSFTYQDMLKANTLMTAITVPIDTDTLTLSTGYPTPDFKHVEIGQRVNREDMKFGFKTLSIA